MITGIIGIIIMFACLVFYVYQISYSFGPRILWVTYGFMWVGVALFLIDMNDGGVLP